MTKIYKKEDCEFVEGRVVCGNEVVAVDRTVFNLFDVLEEGLQKARYLLAQPKEQKAPSIDGFERASCKPEAVVRKPYTPTVDAMVQQAISAMKECDKKEAADDINEMLKEFQPLVEFATSRFVIDSPTGTIEPFDLPELGDPLKIEAGDLARAAFVIKKADMHMNGETPSAFGLVEVGGETEEDPEEWPEAAESCAPVDGCGAGAEEEE